MRSAVHFAFVLSAATGEAGRRENVVTARVTRHSRSPALSNILAIAITSDGRTGATNFILGAAISGTGCVELNSLRRVCRSHSCGENNPTEGRCRVIVNLGAVEYRCEQDLSCQEKGAIRSRRSPFCKLKC